MHDKAMEQVRNRAGQGSPCPASAIPFISLQDLKSLKWTDDLSVSVSLTLCAKVSTPEL